MIDHNFFNLLDAAERERQASLEDAAASEPQKQRAADELAQLQGARSTFAFLQAWAQQEISEATEPHRLVRPQPRTAAQKELARMALAQVAQLAAFTGPDGVEGLLLEPVRMNSALWLVAVESQATLRQGGIDLAAVAVDNAPWDRIDKELALVGVGAVELSKEARARVDSRFRFTDARPMAAAWDAACMERGLWDCLSVENRNPEAANFGFPLALLAPQMGWGGPRGASDPDEKGEALARAGARAREWMNAPERLLLRVAGGRTRGSHEETRQQLAEERAQADAFKQVARRMPRKIAPELACACASLLTEQSPFALAALAACRKNGARMATPAGKPTAWGLAVEDALQALGLRAERAKTKREAHACKEAILSFAQWAQEDAFLPEGGSWSARFARKTLDWLSQEASERMDHEPQSCVRVCEELETAPEILDAHAIEALGLDMVGEHLEWGELFVQNEEEEAHAKATFGAASMMGLLTDRGGDFTAEREVWERLRVCVNRLERDAGLRAKNAKRKALAL